jgi:IclR family pca regulon transcriptional regulator
MRRNHDSGSSGAGGDRRSFVASLEKGLHVLTCFDRVHSRLTLSEVARALDESPASARRSLLTLVALGYVAHDGKRFWLLPKVLLFANAFFSSRPLPTLAQPLLDGLSERTRESASIAQLVDGDAMIVARATARRSLTVGLRIGSRLPIHLSATGRVLLAAMPIAEARARVAATSLAPLTSRSTRTVEAVLAQVEACRDRGYAVCDGELELAVRSMAVPVRDRAGRVVAAMSIAVRAERWALGDFVDGFLPALRRAQKRLADLLPDH